jgi:hypothetical protein
MIHLRAVLGRVGTVALGMCLLSGAAAGGDPLTPGTSTPIGEGCEGCVCAQPVTPFLEATRALAAAKPCVTIEVTGNDDNPDSPKVDVKVLDGGAAPPVSVTSAAFGSGDNRPYYSIVVEYKQGRQQVLKECTFDSYDRAKSTPMAGKTILGGGGPDKYVTRVVTDAGTRFTRTKTDHFFVTVTCERP